MTKLRLVVFDCDGTLVDSQAPITRSMVQAFREVGLPYPGDNAVKGVIGLSLHDAALVLLPGEVHSQAPDLVASYRRGFADLRLNDDVHEPLYPGVVEALDKLKKENVVMGVASGKSHKGLTRTLGLHGLLSYFSTLQSADFHPGKPHPSMLFKAFQETGARPEAALFVGDTTFDIEMGKNAGVSTLGVAWGYHARGRLEEAGATAIIEGMDEVVHHALML